MSTKRIAWLDVAKGLGILLVVLGHNHIKDDFPLVYQTIYSFHMPFFFLVSGMFFKKEYGFWQLVKRRFKSLLLPYIAAVLTLYLTSALYSDMGLPTILRRLGKAVFAGTNSLDWPPLWFLPHLFLLNIFAFVVIKLIYDRLAKGWLRALLLLALLGLGVATLKAFWPFTFSLAGHAFRFDGLPWTADALLVTGAFFLAGYELRRSLPFEWLDSRWVLLGATALFFGLNLLSPATLDFYVRRYDSFVIVTLKVLSGSLMVLAFARWLERGWHSGFRALQYVGGASIVVLIFHYAVQFYLHDKLVAVGLGEYPADALSFAAGVLVPLFIYACVLRPNPLLASWFGVGQRAAP